MIKTEIGDHVDDENQMPYGELLRHNDSLCSKKLNKDAIFINLSGFFNLIHDSEQPLAKKIRKCLDDEILPSLVKYGSYSMQPYGIHRQTNNVVQDNTDPEPLIFQLNHVVGKTRRMEISQSYEVEDIFLIGIIINIFGVSYMPLFDFDNISHMVLILDPDS